MRKLCLALLLLVPSVAAADDAKKAPTPTPSKPAPKVAPVTPVEPAAPAEVKATVAAFKGNWTFASSITAPGADKPANFKMTFRCKAIAGGNGVSCDAKAKTPMGPFEGTFLVAYDPYSKAVHFIGVTNSFEVHDHVCQWKGTDLDCKPLKGGMGAGGDEVTEDVSMKFEGKTCNFTSTTHMKDGSKLVFEGKGKK